MTPRELIYMLNSTWDLEKPFEVRVQNNPFGGTEKQVILAQGNNTINLMGDTTAELVEVQELPVGARFGWRKTVWRVTERGLNWIEAQNEQFSNYQVFKETTTTGEPSWFTRVMPIETKGQV